MVQNMEWGCWSLRVANIRAALSDDYQVVAADMITVRCLIIVMACKASSVLMTWSLRVGPRSSEGPARAVDAMDYVVGQDTENINTT